MKRVFINNYEVACNAGNTKELMKAVYENKSALVESEDFIKDSTAGLGIMHYDDFYQLLKEVVAKVLNDSNLNDFKDTLVIVGSSVGGMQECENIYYKTKSYKDINPNRYSMNTLSDFLLKEFGFYDSRAISTACTSSANALLLAKRLINVGAYKNILVIGADGLCRSTVLGFHALSVLSSKKCRPFDVARDGMNVAEAIAVLLLQDEKESDAIELKGVGASSDAYHMTNPDPSASGAMNSMYSALSDAGLKVEDISYVNAHGTATLANDTVEALAVEKIFGDKVFINSTKAITGHTLGAAGAIEAVISCEVIKHGLIPAQTGLVEAENKNINIPMKNVKADVKNVISNSFAFGGNNASLVFGVVK